MNKSEAEIPRTDLLASVYRWGSRYDSGSQEVRDTIVAFAQEKLVGSILDDNGIFAAIATRIPLEFSATNAEASEMEGIQVERHLHVCIAVRSGLVSIKTISASEPLVAEAARRILSPVNVPSKLLHAIRLSGMDKGDRGEMVAMLLLLNAYDAVRRKQDKNGEKSPLAVPLVDFLDQLIASPHIDSVHRMRPTHGKKSGKMLENAFKDAKVYFTHFVRVHGRGTLNRALFPTYVARGAAILCQYQQEAVDLCIPIVHDGLSLRTSNIGCLLIQVKNDKSFKQSPSLSLFSPMDPVNLAVFRDGTPAPPIIRLVFALASNKSAVVPITRENLEAQDFAYPNTGSHHSIFGVQGLFLQRSHSSRWTRSPTILSFCNAANVS